VVARHGGREVEVAGRKCTASFPFLQEAVACAAEIRRHFSPAGTAAAFDVRPRIGISAGTPVTENPDFFGETLRSAALLTDYAAEGEVLLAPSIYEHPGGEALMLPAEMRVLSDGEQQFLVQLSELAARVWNQPQLQVSDIAKMLGMSTSQLYRQSVALTGCAPGRFMQDYRLEKAAVSIERREGTLSEIAFASGFCSLSYFSKCFRRKYGLLPSRYAAVSATTVRAGAVRSGAVTG
ncbi:MAG: helix-turn-helix domain-containing protein, partial [Bacteroidota bacterium]|nr:helix-turn-helix domain-containing protein [Bacteroidota bacterium]